MPDLETRRVNAPTSRPSGVRVTSLWCHQQWRHRRSKEIACAAFVSWPIAPKLSTWRYRCTTQPLLQLRGCDVTRTLSESEPNFSTGVFGPLRTGQRRDSFALRKSDVTNEPYRRHVVVTLSNRQLRRRTFGPKQLANQTRCDRRFRCDVTTGQAPSCLWVTSLHFERRAGDRTGRISDRRALASQDFRAVFSQDHVEDRRHVRAEFRRRHVNGQRVTADRKFRGALDTHAGTSPPRTASRTNRRDVVDRPVTSISENRAFFFFFKSNAEFFH